MHEFRRKFLLNSLKLADIFILIASLIFTSLIITSRQNHITLEEFLLLRIKVINFIGFLGMVLLWHLLFNGFHLYRSRRLERGHKERKGILKATTSATAIFLLAGYIFNIRTFTPRCIPWSQVSIQVR